MDSGDRRALILRAAADLYLARGFGNVSMDDVLAVVGGSKSTLYRYFADKTDLFRSAVELLIDEHGQPLLDVQPTDERLAGADVARVLTEFGRGFAAVVLEPSVVALHRLVAAEAERMPGLGRTFVDRVPASGHAALGDYLRGLDESGALNIPDPVLAATQLSQAMLGSFQLRLLTNPADRPAHAEVEASIAAAVRTFLHGASRTVPSGSRPVPSGT